MDQGTQNASSSYPIGDGKRLCHCSVQVPRKAPVCPWALVLRPPRDDDSLLLFKGLAAFVVLDVIVDNFDIKYFRPGDIFYYCLLNS